MLAAILFVSLGLVLSPVAAMADATHNWEGGTSGSVRLWSVAANWDENAVPVAGDDVVFDATDPPTVFTCELDDSTPPALDDLTILGDSPTKMTFNIKDGALTVNGVATLGDYAELDVDENLTIADTDMSGDIWVNVENGNTMDLGTTVDVVGSAAGGISCTLHLQDNASGTFKGATVTVDADTPDATRGFKLSSSGSTFDVTTKLVLKSDQTAGTNRAKLWILAGTINIDDGDEQNNGILEVDGGDHATRRVDIDIDDILIAEETQFKSGYVTVDVATGKTAYAGDVVFEGSATSGEGAIVTKTGSGTFSSGPPPA